MYQKYFLRIKIIKEIIGYRDDEKTKIKERYFIDEKGRKNGPYELYYENGQLRTKCVYKNNKKANCLHIIYSSNGKIGVKCTYKDGDYDGLYEWFYDNGQLATRYTFKNREKDSPCENYDENGRLTRKGAFIANEFVNGEDAYQKAVKEQ